MSNQAIDMNRRFTMKSRHKRNFLKEQEISGGAIIAKKRVDAFKEKNKSWLKFKEVHNIK